MEVSETKLVNFAEKTKFDVSSEITGPTVQQFGGFYEERLTDNGLTLVYPDIAQLLKPDGTWDNTKSPVFRFSHRDPVTGVETVYDALDQIPGISPVIAAGLERGQDAFVEKWEDFLKTLGPDTKVIPVFELDPNQLLSVSGGYKTLLRRPL